MSREMRPHHRIPGRRLTALLTALVATAGLTSCGHSAAGPSAPDPGTGGPPVPTGSAYHGPLHVRVPHPHKAPKPERFGAAGHVIDCRTTVGVTGGLPGSDYDGEMADSADGALQVAEDNWPIDGAMDDYRVAARTASRVLYVYRVDRRVKEALIVHHGRTITGPGWHLESWARCDWSEFPDDVAEQDGRQIWRDASGHRAPTPRVVSFTGPAHCDWQSMTFLHLGKATYVRAPQAELKAYFDQPYRAHLRLPEHARDTGYHRDGSHLWVSPDRQRAYVGERGDVEQWPRTVKPLGCA